MKRYLLVGLIWVAVAVVCWWVYSLIGGDDADSDGDSVGGRNTPVPSPSVVGMPGPPWDAPAATPTPGPVAAARSTDVSESPTGAAEAVAEPEAEWAPAPVAPAAPPEPAAALEGDVVEIIHQVFGQNAGAALAVAWCETGGTLDPTVVGAAGERGLFQIHPTHWFWLDEDRLFDPLYNAQMAYELSRGGTNWSSWSCQP